MREPLQQLIDEMRVGLEGVTPGPWVQCGGMSAKYRAVHSPSGYIVFGMADSTVDREVGEPIRAPNWDAQDRNARHIARCSPDRISRLLDAANHYPKAIVALARARAWLGDIYDPNDDALHKLRGDLDAILSQAEGPQE